MGLPSEAVRVSLISAGLRYRATPETRGLPSADEPISAGACANHIKLLELPVPTLHPSSQHRLPGAPNLTPGLVAQPTGPFPL